MTYEQARTVSNWPENFKPMPLTQEDDVFDGALVIISNLFGGLSLFRSLPEQ